MAAPTPQEIAILPKFRQRLQDLKLQGSRDTDIYLLKWLRARELNLNEAEDMLRKSLKWRADNDMDSILGWTAPPFLINNYPIYVDGFDHDNSPIAVLPFGRWDIRKMISVGHKEEYIRYIDQLFELVMDKMEGRLTRDNIQVTQYIIIFDMEGLSMSTLASKAAVETIMENLRRFEQNHPETLKAAYVINASRVFTLLFAIVRPILSQRTFGKVQIFNNNASKWQRALFDVIPRDQLPTSVGGTASGGANTRNEQADNELTTVTVASGNILPMAFQVNAKGSALTWSFKTENYDIGYWVTYDQTGKVVVPTQRVASGSKLCEGSVICDETGVYIFNFDNSFSRFRSKVVHHRITVLPPSQ